MQILYELRRFQGFLALFPAYSFPPTRSSDERKARVKRGFWHDSSFLEGAITVVILVIDSHRTLRRVSDNMEASGLNGKSLDSET